MKRRAKYTALVTTAVLATTAVAAIMGTVTVESAEVVLRQSPSPIAPSAGKFKQGTSLTVLEDRGTYARVKAGDTQGWLRVADLKPRTFAAPAVQNAVLTGNANAGRATESASSKGLGDGVNDIALAYSQSSGIPSTALEKLMQQRRELIESGKVRQFAVEGHVGKP